jgi:hypothetical protein
MASKRFLLMVRAGDNSLHRSWLGGERNWDLIVSWFGNEPYVPVADERVIVQKGWKWDMIGKHLRDDPSLLRRYDYFHFPDDDIETTSEQINRLFELSAAHQLAVSQPALTPNSYFNFPHLLVCSSFLLRYTDYVECMAPCLSRAALEQIHPYFAITASGFGLDNVWTRLAPDNERRAAVIDATIMRHTRPQGAELGPSLQAAGRNGFDEARELYARFDSDWPGHTVRCYAGLARDGTVRRQFATAWHMFLDNLATIKHYVRPVNWNAFLEVYRFAHRKPPLSQLRDRNSAP